MSKPKIRFNGFTEDWEQRKLGEICESFEYGLNAASKEYDGENKYIRITDIDDGTHEFLQEDVTSPDMNLTGAENYRLKYGDILFARTGASVGKTYIYKYSDGLVYYAGFLIRGRVKNGFVPEFVFQNSLTGDYEKFIRITSQRSGQPGVNAQEYAGYEISMPTYAEQKKIGEYFRNLDNLITLHQRKCEETKKLKEYMLQKMFPKDGERVPEIRFSGFTDDWEQRKFGEVAKYRNGKAHENEIDIDGEYIVVNSKFVSTDGEVRKYSKSQNEPLYKNEIAFVLSDVPNGRAIARTFLVDKSKKYTLNQRIAGITPLEKTVPYYLHIRMNRNQYFLKFDDGNKQTNLSINDVMNYEDMYPGYEEQKKIAAYFRTLDHLITLHQRKCDELKRFKKFMLKNMFL